MFISLTDALIRNVLAVVALLLALTVGVQTWRLHSTRADLAECVAVRAREAAIAQRMFDAAVGAARESEARWAATLTEATNHAEEQLARARADAAVLGSDVGRLRDAARAAASRCTSTQGAAPAPSGPPAADPGVLLADVLAGLAEAGAGVAEEAGRRGIAGSACERAYDAVSVTASRPE